MKKLVDQLQNLNFTQYESRAYLSLLEQGNITGYELAKNSGIPASKIYAVLNKLMEKEVILALDSEPVKYTPLPPKEVLSRLKGDYLDTVNNLDSILSTEGIDGCIIGPYDLSGSLGVPGNFEHPDVLAALKKVELTCKERKVALGMHVIQPDYRLVTEKIAKGYSFIGFSLDILFLGNSCRRQLKSAYENIRRKP